MGNVNAGEWLTDRFDWGEWQPVRWQFFLAIILFLISWIAYYILKMIFSIIMAAIGKALPSNVLIDDDLKKYCQKPFCKLGKVFVWLACIALLDFPNNGLPLILRKICVVFMFWYILWLGLGVINVMSEAYLRFGKLSNREIQATRMLVKVAKAVWVVIFGIIILQNVGINIANLLAYTVVFVAALGLGCKDVIKNFYGGVRILVARPFVRGDNIELKGKYEVAGQVAKVGMSDTTIKSVEGYLVIVPNQLFVTEPVVNNSKNVDDELARATKDENDEPVGMKLSAPSGDYPPASTPEDPQGNFQPV